MTKWLPEFTRQTWSFDSYTNRFGYACAYSSGQPSQIRGHRGLIHSTEGSSWPVYSGGKDNPNFTVDPWKKQRRQHVPADIAARATMANNDAYVQIEIVGFCDLAYATKYGMEKYYLERMGADELAYIAESLAIIGEACSIPVQSSLTWAPYPRSAWADNGVRMSQAALNGYSGWLGHQHAPKPDIHGDPGTWPHTMDLWAAMRGSNPAPHPVNPPTPSPVAPKAESYVVGPVMTKAWQKLEHTPQDGAISGQDAGRKDCFDVSLWPAIQWQATGRATGSQLVKAAQKRLGLHPDGIVGPATAKAIQKWVGVTPDGVLGPKSTAALAAKIGVK